MEVVLIGCFALFFIAMVEIVDRVCECIENCKKEKEKKRK